MQIQPSDATIYAGVPTTFQVQGDRAPYTVSSSEATVLQVPSQVGGNSFTVVPNNPGVIDAGLGPNDLPVRSVTITVRGSLGSSTSALIKVARNFLTGYGVTFVQQGCPSAPPAPATPPTGNVACSGGDTAAIFEATTDGNLHGDMAFNVSIIYGNASLRNPANGQSGQTVQVVSDHAGTVTVLVHTNANTPTQLGVIRIQEASTGVYADHVFIISGNQNATTLTVVPAQFTFTGPDKNTCGTGTGTFEVFDGSPPYTALSAIPSLVTVSPATSNTQPGVFTISAGNPAICGDASVIVTDSVGAHAEVKVTTALGTTTPTVPPAPLLVSPSTLTLACGTSASASIAGGASTTYSASSPDPNINVLVSGSTITVTRLSPDVGPPSAATTNITVSDGTSFTLLKVNSPTTCP